MFAKLNVFENYRSFENKILKMMSCAFCKSSKTNPICKPCNNSFNEGNTSILMQKWTWQTPKYSILMRNNSKRFAWAYFELSPAAHEIRLPKMYSPQHPRQKRAFKFPENSSVLQIMASQSQIKHDKHNAELISTNWEHSNVTLNINHN